MCFLENNFRTVSLTAQSFAGRCGFTWPIFCHGAEVTWTCSCSSMPRMKSSSVWSSGLTSWDLATTENLPLLLQFVSYPSSSTPGCPEYSGLAQRWFSLLSPSSTSAFFHQATKEGSANLCTSFHVTVELQEFLIMLCSPFGLWKQHERARNSGGGEYSLQGHRTDLVVIDIFPLTTTLLRIE